MNRTMRGGRRVEARVLIPLVVTMGLAAGLVVFWKSGLFDQIGRVPTVMLICSDVFIAVLLWYRAMKR